MRWFASRASNALRRSARSFAESESHIEIFVAWFSWWQYRISERHQIDVSWNTSQSMKSLLISAHWLMTKLRIQADFLCSLIALNLQNLFFEEFDFALFFHFVVSIAWINENNWRLKTALFNVAKQKIKKLKRVHKSNRDLNCTVLETSND